jgi:hypothetical protein
MRKVNLAKSDLVLQVFMYALKNKWRQILKIPTNKMTTLI